MVSYPPGPSRTASSIGLVYGLTAIPAKEVPFYQRPEFWAVLVGVVFVILIFIFW